MLKPVNNKSLDELSLAILQELCDNSRITAAEIGRRVGLTAPAVAERISKMEDAGYIKGYRTVLDFDKLGLSIQAFILFKANIKHHDMMKVIPGITEVMEWHTVSGNSSMLLKVITSSREQLAKVIAHLEEYGDTTTSLILESSAEMNMLGKARLR